MKLSVLTLPLLLSAFALSSRAADAPAPAAPAMSAAAPVASAKFSWQPAGLTIALPNFEMKMGARAQFSALIDRADYCGDCFNVLGVQVTTRASAGSVAVSNLPFTLTPSGNPTTGDSLTTASLAVKRIKPFFSGWAFDPRFKFDIQMEATAGGGAGNFGLREADIDIEFARGFQLKIGQWKGPFGRQRIMSDGKNQFQDNSLAVNTFAMGYEDGVMAYGYFGGAARDRFEFDLGLFNGVGQNPGAAAGTGNKLLYAGRFVCTPFGKFDYSESAVDQPKNLLFYLGGSANTNGADAGAGTLKITETRVDKYGLETGFKYLRYSASAEWFRRVTRSDIRNYSALYDPATGAPAPLASTVRIRQEARGWHLQGGVFAVPRVLEFALRYSQTDPNTDLAHQKTLEYRLGVNWYLSRSHFHKLQLDAGRLRRQFNGKFVDSAVTVPVPLPAGRTSSDFDDRSVNETQYRLQYQFWF